MYETHHSLAQYTDLFDLHIVLCPVIEATDSEFTSTHRSGSFEVLGGQPFAGQHLNHGWTWAPLHGKDSQRASLVVLAAWDACQRSLPVPSAVALASWHPEFCMQDELALVREDLRTLRQQRRGEAAKPQQNDRLFESLDKTFTT